MYVNYCYLKEHRWRTYNLFYFPSPKLYEKALHGFNV